MNTLRYLKSLRTWRPDKGMNPKEDIKRMINDGGGCLSLGARLTQRIGLDFTTYSIKNTF